MKIAEKTKIKSSEKYLIGSYSEQGKLYKNTDENKMVEYIVVVDNCIWMVNTAVFDIIAQYSKEKIKEPEKVNDSVIGSIEDKGMVSEDFALKMVGMVLNKEKFKEVK